MSIRAKQSETARSLLIEWGNLQENWLREIILSALSGEDLLEQKKIDGIYSLFLSEKDLSKDVKIIVPKIESGTSQYVSEVEFYLDEIRNLINVNALKENQSIKFSKRMTVVFGENGSGKTGYVRVLKNAAAVRTKEPVLSNVNEDDKGKNQLMSADIIINSNGIQKEFKWNGNAISDVSTLDVFDSRFSNVHVEEDLTYSYIPNELKIYPIIQRTIERIRDLLEDKIGSIESEKNVYLENVSIKSTYYEEISRLSADSVLETIISLKNIGKGDDLEKARNDLKVLTNISNENEILEAECDIRKISELLDFVSLVEGCDFDLANEKMETIELLKNRMDFSSRQYFSEFLIENSSEDIWSDFIKSGTEYIKSLSEKDKFPSENHNCIYCQQVLSSSAVELIQRYIQFSDNKISAELETTKNERNNLINIFNSKSFVQKLTFFSGESCYLVGHDEFNSIFLGFVGDLNSIALQIASNKRLVVQGLHKKLNQIKAYLNTESSKKSELKSAIFLSSKHRNEEIIRIEQFLIDSEVQKYLYEKSADIRKFIEQKIWAKKARPILSKFKNIFKSLTELSKEANGVLLNSNFEMSFNSECAKLSCPKVSLTFPGRQGVVTRKKSIASSHSPEAVLSEGEQKVIGLADFLAEASIKTCSPLIFDDPVNSLDYKRLYHVVTRLVEISKQRQVIVFTHNIWFASEILSAFNEDRENCFYYDVERIENIRGHVTKGSHPRADNYKSLKTKINVLIEENRKSTGEKRQYAVEKGYEYLRNICEVALEANLFKGAIERYRPNIRMTVINEIKFESLKESCEVLHRLFEKSCRIIASHSQPIETLNIVYSLEDLEKDWKDLQMAM